MMPKNSRLTRTVRIVIMLSLISAFFVISPLLLLYAGGYRFNLETFSVLKKGVISIDIEPTHASVYINNRKIDKRIPIQLTDSAPGTYHIRIEAEGYHTWEKDSVVESNKTTYIRDITLPKVASPISTELGLNEDELSTLSVSTDNAFAVYTTNTATTTNRYLYSVETNTSEMIQTTVVDTSAIIDWSPYAPIATIILTTDDVKTVSILDAEQNTLSTGTPLLDGDTYHWSLQDPNALYITQSTLETYRIVPDEQTFVGVASSTNAYVLDTDSIASIVQVDNQSFISLSFENTVSALSEPIDTIRLLTDSLLIGSKDDQTYIYSRNNTSFTFLEVLDGTSFLQYGERDIIVFSPWQIWTISPNGDVTLLLRTSDPIETIIPFDEQGVLLMTTQSGISLFNPGYYTTTQLLSATNIKATMLHRSSDIILFSTTLDGVFDLYSLEY